MRSNCAFTFDHYFDVLDHAKNNNFRIMPVGEYDSSQSGRVILMRHDVDISLQHAYQLALLEKEHRITSTYLVLFHSQFYNALSYESARIIREISSMGHEIGLHYDTNFPSTLREEAIVLSSISGQPVTTIAQHNPSVTPIPIKNSEQEFVDAKDLPIPYVSDSVQNWRNGCMCVHVNKTEKLQILTHPIWWSADGRVRRQIMKDIHEMSIQKIEKSLGALEGMHTKYFEDLQRG